MIELKKIRALTVKNPYNLDAHWIMKISLVLHSAYMVAKDQDKCVFYVNNYINWDYFNQLYNSD